MDRQTARSRIVEIADYPKPGVLFKDVIPVSADVDALRWCLDEISAHYKEAQIDLVVGIEARGFILGAALALHMNIGFVPIRKVGKLPRETYSAEYTLEYGTDTIEIHRDALHPGQRVLLVDDVLATGGTANAAISLLEQCGAVGAGLAVLLNLDFLGGDGVIRSHHPDCDIFTLFQD